MVETKSAMPMLYINPRALPAHLTKPLLHGQLKALKAHGILREQHPT